MDDASPEVPLGKPSPFVQALWMNQRIDGVTPDFYSRNWYIHGGHPDGEEAETDESRANRREMEARGMQRWYIQNRVREPITPTDWVINGFADLTFPSLLPTVGERYDPKPGSAKSISTAGRRGSSRAPRTGWSEPPTCAAGAVWVLGDCSWLSGLAVGGDDDV